MIGKLNNSSDDRETHQGRAPSDHEWEWPWSPDALLPPIQALLDASTMESVLQASLEILIPHAITGLSILLISGLADDRHLEIVATWTQNGQPIFPPSTQFSTHEVLFQPLFATGESKVINDLTTENGISKYLRAALLQAKIKALVALPLGSAQDLIGAVLVTRSTAKAFSPENIRAFETWARLAKETIRNLWHTQETERALAKTLALYEISHRLLESKNLHDLLKNVLDSELFEAAGGTIALLEPSKTGSSQTEHELVFSAATGASAERILGMRMPVSKGVVGWVVRENEPAMVPDAYADERFYPQVDQDVDFRTQSILCAPLRVEGQVIGAIELVDVCQELLSDQGMRLLSQIADQAARFIQSQRLLEETQRQAHELSLLLDVSHDLTSTLESGETLRLISSRVLDLVRADGCHVFLLQPGPDAEDLLVPVASSDRFAEQILSTPLKVGQGITGRAAQSGVGIIANRVDLDPRGFQVPGTPRDPENLISVPLISEGQTLGVMTVSRLGEEEFGKNDLDIVSAMANQAATVLEKTRLLKKAQQRSRELAALNAVVSTASQSLTQEEILNSTLERITQILPNSSGIICLHHPSTGDLQLAIQSNLAVSLEEFLQPGGLHDYLCQATARTGHAHIITDLSTDPLLAAQLSVEQTNASFDLGLRAYLGTPLIAHGQTLGTLSIFSAEPNTFVPADADLLTAIGQQVGIAIRNAQLYEQTERALDESTALYETSQAISKALELEDVLRITVDKITDHIGADQGQLILFDKTAGYGQVMTERHPTPGIEGVHIPLEGALSHEAFSSRGEAIYIEDVSNDPLAKSIAMLIDDEVATALLVPLMVQARLIGFISLTAETHRTFPDSKISFCRALADRAALATENRRLFSQTFYGLQRTTLLYQASRALSQAQDLQDVLRAITDNLPIKALDQGWILLLDSGSNDDRDPAMRSAEISALWDHEDDNSLFGRRFSSRELPFIAQLQSAETWAITDLSNEARFDSHSIAVLQNLGVKSALVVPLATSETLLGWLLLTTHHRTHVFTPDEMRPYQALADQAAVAIRNQQLLKQVQDSLEEVQTTHRQYLRDEWADYLQSKEEHLTSIAYDQGPLLPVEGYRQPLVGTEKKHSGEIQDGASLVAPLKIRDQVIGVLGLEDPEQSYEWTADELNMVEEIADRVAQAVENARLLDETQSSLAETERLYQATGQLANADSAAQIIDVLAREVQAVLGPAFCGTILRTGPNPATRVDWFETSVQWNAPEVEIPRGTRLDLTEHTFLNRFLGHRNPIIIKDTDLSPDDNLTWEIFAQPRAMVAIPLAAGNSRLGVINVTSQNDGLPDQRLMRFLQNLADRAAVALESTRLYAETQRRATQLEAAAKVSRAASSILEQDELLPRVVELIRDHFNYYHAQIFLLDPTEQWAVLEASTGDVGRKLLGRDYALMVGGDSLIGYVTATGEARNAIDVSQDSIYSITPDLPETRSELAIPIKIGGKVIGALDMQSTQTAAFGLDDVAVLSLLTDQLATAIENARLYQEQLETAIQLREVDRLKTRFLANMSHELRTPLNSIIGFSRVILKGIDGPINDLQKQDLTAIHSSGQLLLKLINDVLDLSKIAAGKMELAFEEIDLEDTVKSVIATAGALVKDKPEVKLKHTIAPDLPLIIADATRMRQILLNLLSNAAKFTDKGDIELNISHDPRFVFIQVSDTGVGIPHDKFDLIFQEFEQVDGSATRAIGGTGLGLPICRHFVEMHGGHIWVESQVGVGSSFTVQLPIQGPGAIEETEDDKAATLHQRVILAIDDEVDVINLYKRYLEKQDYYVIGLSDSKQAVNKARELQPYAILLDLLMPNKDGWSIIQELKTDPETQTIPIIMCSIVSAAGRGFSLGAADYLVKPITAERLLTALARLENGQDHTPGRSRKVLIIDDTMEDRRLLRRVLESTSEPYHVLEASDGLDGIEIIHTERPDLIVLDLMMPGMDGFSVLEALKSDKEMRSIPIVIVTARELSERERARINGQATALFQKGLFKEDELLQDLDRALDRVSRTFDKKYSHKE